MSPTCFSQYICGLIKSLKETKCGIKVGNETVRCLAYADDIVLFAGSEHELQVLFDAMYRWCQKWRVVINNDKTKAIHFRRRNVKQTEVRFRI